jgi:hypothetical protein
MLFSRFQVFCSPGAAAGSLGPRQGQLFHNMADIDDITDELVDASTKPATMTGAQGPQAPAYKAQHPILTAAVQQQGEIARQMTAFLSGCPKARASPGALGGRQASMV